MANPTRASSALFVPERSPSTFQEFERHHAQPLLSRETTPDDELSEYFEEVEEQVRPAVRRDWLLFERSKCQVRETNVFHEVLKKIIKHFKSACLATSARVSNEDKRAYEKLHSTLRTLERAKKLVTLIRAWDSDGKFAFIEARNMLNNETKLYQKLLSKMPKQTVKDSFRVEHCIPHIEQVKGLILSMGFCDKLVLDLKDYVRAAKNAGRPIGDA